MRWIAITGVILGAGVGIACESCPEVARDDSKDGPLQAACAELSRERDSVTQQSCAALCDPSYTQCRVGDSYRNTWYDANRDAGRGSYSCPAPADGGTVVPVHCKEIDPEGRLALSCGFH